jgi:response regulator RpfG family c-di-GMP phosphodiesterase
LEVIDQLRKQEFDIIFMDVQMPEMDGFETTRFIIHKLQLTKRPVIVAMTAFALEGDKEKCIEVGMNDYISKPFLIEEIVERIRKWVSKNNNVKEDINSGSEVREEKMLNEKTINRLRQIMGESDPTFFDQVMRMFVSQGEEQVMQIRDAVAAGDIKQVGALAHKLKGSSLNVGANAMAETCRTMEIRTRENDSTGLDELARRLEKEFAATRREIEK